MEPFWSDGERTLYHGDCLGVLPTLPDESVDFVFTDPPYPEISRPYGRWTEAEWRELVDAVVVEFRRILKPTGSAMFVLQPNSEKVGRIRPWLWEFMAYWAREWNQVQDVWWWKTDTRPLCGTHLGYMRPSLKCLFWLGEPDCYHDQAAVMWSASETTMTANLEDRALRHYRSGAHDRNGRCYERGQKTGLVTPFNVFPITGSQVGHIHGASTPQPLSEKMISYACPTGGLVLDPFFGAGTVGVVCKETGRRCIGIEKELAYCEASVSRIEAAKEPERTLFQEAVGA